MSVHQAMVTEDEADIRLDRWFRRHYPNLTQGALQKLCRTGQVRVDGKRATPADRLAPGQALRIPPLPQVDRPAPPPVDPYAAREIAAMTLYEDAHVLVLNKPSGLATQGGPNIDRHVDKMLESIAVDGVKPRLVHRIDRDTSGLLLIGKTPGAAGKLAAAFRGREVEKTYWAVVVGRPELLSGSIDQPLAKVGAGAGALVVGAKRDDPEAAHALTDYEVLDQVGRKFAWLALRPLTGRTHQLRVHCESLGTPILGDPRYGGPLAHVEGFEDRLHLHARRLSLPHPAGGRLEVEAPVPKHMLGTFRALGFAPGETRAPRKT